MYGLRRVPATGVEEGEEIYDKMGYWFIAVATTVAITVLMR